MVSFASYGTAKSLQPYDSSTDSWDEHEARSLKPVETRRYSALPILLLVVFGICAAVLVYDSSAGSKIYSTLVNFGDIVDVDIDINTQEMSFTLSKDGYDPLIFFTPLDISIVKYAILEDYIAVIEPYADMTLNIFGVSDDKYYQYSACNVADTSECYNGEMYPQGGTDTTINIQCTPLVDDYYITVNELSSSNSAILRTSYGYAKCMYVRREIRTLSDADLESLMDAMYMMWQVSEAEGQKTYGTNFHSSKFLLEFHFFNAAWQDSDHIHEGNGFLPQHIKMTNLFDLSIQSVNPAVSLPFWDFTIESAQNISVMLSPIFTATMFGSMPRSVDQYWGWTYRNDSMLAGAIPDGRWAMIRADTNDRYSDLDYGYSYLRAPWNMNPSPYLSRFTSTNKHLPSCTAYYDLLSYTDIDDFLFESPYAAHAGAHGVLGGVYGCDAMDGMLAQGYLMDADGQIELCKNWIFYIKEFYRLNYLAPMTNCTAKEDALEFGDLTCGFICNDEYVTDFVFELKNILNSDGDCVPYDLQDVGWIAWKDFICTGDGFKVFGGDHLEAASPADPSFWPIHPTLERVLQAKYLAGGFETNDWPTDPLEQYVCDKASCFDSETQTTDYFDTCCFGHYQDDQLMDAANGDADAGYGLTNREVMDGTDPTSVNYSMPYIYSDFDWSHCELVGLDLTELMENLYDETVGGTDFSYVPSSGSSTSASSTSTNKGPVTQSSLMKNTMKTSSSSSGAASSSTTTNEKQSDTSILKKGKSYSDRVRGGADRRRVPHHKAR